MATTFQATPVEIQLSSSNDNGIYHNPNAALADDLANLTSSLLNENHKKFHIYFNDKGFHNHVVHHLLSLYALNTDPKKVHRRFDNDASYQLPLAAPTDDVVADMQKERQNILKYLPGDQNQVDIGNESSGKQYPNFLAFWTKEIEKLDVKGVLDEWVFKGDDVAEKVFGRLFAGFLHPFIHAGFALEFHQPALLAEALAEACVHDNWVYPLIQQHRARSAKLKASNTAPRALRDLLLAAHANDKIRTSAHFDDANKLRDGVLVRALEEIYDLVSQWYIPNPTWETLNEKIAEHIHATFLFTSLAAFHSVTRDDKPVQLEPRLDFFYIHDTNSSIFFSAFAHDPLLRETLGLENIGRMLEAKVAVDLGMYGSRGAPSLSPDKFKQLQTYETRVPEDRGKGWNRIFERVSSLTDDDSHAVKFIRALANAEVACKPYEDRDWCVIKGDVWLRIGWLAVDSWLQGAKFVRNAGWDESWKDIPEWKL